MCILVERMDENYEKIVDGLFTRRYCLKSRKRNSVDVENGTAEIPNGPDLELISITPILSDFADKHGNFEKVTGKLDTADHRCHGDGKSEEFIEVWNELSDLKRTLNETKNKLSDKDLAHWHDHTKRTNPTGLTVSEIRARVRTELCTQAWCKFYEILVAFPNLVRSRGRFRSLHLCEAPGAFVNALHYYLHKKRLWITEWDWKANSLNPYYEGNPYDSMIGDDRFIFHTAKRWIFGWDNTGDITSPSMLDSLLAGGEYDLVTADGSVDCQDDPNGQELQLVPLHYCETVCALHALCEGGNFVLKRFTMFEWSSILLLYLLYCAFEEVHLFKPATSKSGNSELYVICESYRRFSQEHLSQLRSSWYQNCSSAGPFTSFCLPNTVPLSFLRTICSAQRFFMAHQLLMVQFNVHTFRHWTPDLQAQCTAAHGLALDRFLTITDLHSNEEIDTPIVPVLVPEGIADAPWRKNMPWQKRHGTYEQRNMNECQRRRFVFQNIADQLNLLRERLSIGGGLEYRTFIINGYSYSLFSTEWYKEDELHPEPVYGRRLCQVVNSKLCHASLLVSYKDLRSIAEVGRHLKKGSYELEGLELCQFNHRIDEKTCSAERVTGIANDQDCVWMDLTTMKMTKMDWLNFLLLIVSSEKPPQSVELTRSRLLVLTRFSANVLVVLCACYEQVTLIARNNPAGMCTIKAENHRLPTSNAQNFVSYLRRVKYGLWKNQRSGTADSLDLLQFLPMQYIAEPTFYKKLQRFNNTVLLGICDEMLSLVTMK